MKAKELIRLLQGLTDQEQTVYVCTEISPDQIKVAELQAMHMGALVEFSDATLCIQHKDDKNNPMYTGVLLIPGYFQPQQTELRFFGLKPNWGE